MSGIFDAYKGDINPIIKNAELLNVPFKIKRMKFRENVASDYGTKDSMLCTIEIVETGEVFSYFAENTAVLSKLRWLEVNVPKYQDAVFILKKVRSGAGNEYYDIDEAE